MEGWTMMWMLPDQRVSRILALYIVFLLFVQFAILVPIISIAEFTGFRNVRNRISRCSVMIICSCTLHSFIRPTSKNVEHKDDCCSHIPISLAISGCIAHVFQIKNIIILSSKEIIRLSCSTSFGISSILLRTHRTKVITDIMTWTKFADYCGQYLSKIVGTYWITIFRQTFITIYENIKYLLTWPNIYRLNMSNNGTAKRVSCQCQRIFIVWHWKLESERRVNRWMDKSMKVLFLILCLIGISETDNDLHL